MMSDHPRESSPRSERVAWALLAGIFLLALALRLYRLGEQSAWWDDYNGVAHLTVKGFFASMDEARRMNPEGAPFYHVVQWFASFVFGTGEYGQRLFNVLLSSSIVFVLYQLGRSAFGPAAGLLAALLFALSPTHIYHAQSLRIYPLEVFLAALGLLAFTRMLATDSVRWGRVNAVCNGLIAITHFMGLFAIVTQGVALLLLGRGRWPLLLRWSLLQLLCLLPMLLLIVTMPHRPAGVFWHFQLPSAADVLFDLLGDDVHNPPGVLVPGASGQNTPWSLRVAGIDSHAESTRRAFDLALMGAMGLIAALAALRLAFLARPGRGDAEATERRSIWIMLAYWAAPVLALTAMCYLWRPLMHARYTLYSCIGLYVLAGHVCMVYLRAPWLRRAAAAVLALLMGYQLLALLPVNTRTEWRDVAADIVREAGPDDIVLVGAYGPPDINLRTFNYHLPEGSRIPSLASGSVRWTVEQIRCHFLRHPEATPRPRAWFVYNTHFYMGDPEMYHSAFLANGMAFERRHYAGGETIILFQIVDWPGLTAETPLLPGTVVPAPHRPPFDPDHAADLLELPLDRESAREAILRAWDDGTPGEGRQAYLNAFRSAFAAVGAYDLAEHCARALLAMSDGPDLMGEVSYAISVHLPQGRMDRAAEAILRGATGQPLPPEAHVVLAILLRASNEPALAQTAYAQAKRQITRYLRPAIPLLEAYVLGHPDDVEMAALAVRQALYPHWYAGDAFFAPLLGLAAWRSPCLPGWEVTPATPEQLEKLRALLDTGR